MTNDFILWLRSIRYRLPVWWFWYSLPWSRTRRCPGCAGAKRTLNSYDVRDCEVCNGEGTIAK